MARGPLREMPQLSTRAKRIVTDIFLSNTRKEISGCLTWTGHRIPSGMSTFSYNGLTTSAAKWAYHLMVAPVPAGTIVRRTCFNDRCVEPTHLVAGPLKSLPTSPVEAPVEKTWGDRRAGKKPARLRKLRDDSAAGRLMRNLTDEDLRWEITRHAEARARELGFRPDELLLTAAYPENSYISHSRYGDNTAVHQRGDCAIAVNPDDKIILTVLLRTPDRWEHGKDTRDGIST